MKYLIFSDLHGGEAEASFIVNQFKKLDCDKIICLGDVLYHGPRNDIPKGYQPKNVISLLNSLAEDIICVRGNCDAEVDQMVLDFKIHEYLDFSVHQHTIHLEHGHHLDELHSNAEFIFYGHTHIPSIQKKEKQIFINPGSITIPKNGNPPSYIIMDEKGIYLWSVEGILMDQYLF